MIVGAKMREDRRARLRRYLEQIGIRWRRAPDQSCIVGLQQAADLGFGRVSAEHDDDIGRRRQGCRAERLVGFLAERHESARAADDRELQRREDGDGRPAQILPEVGSLPSDAIPQRRASHRTARRLDALPETRPGGVDFRGEVGEFVDHPAFERELAAAVGAARQMLFDKRSLVGLQLARGVPGKKFFGRVVRRDFGLDRIRHLPS